MSQRSLEHIVRAAAVVVSTAVCAVSWSGEGPLVSKSAAEDAAVQRLDIEWTQARRCWQRIARIDQRGTGDAELGQRALDRFFESAHAREMVTDLCNLFSDAVTAETYSHITVRFVDKLPASLDLPDGSFQPPRRGAEAYEVTVRVQRDRDISEDTVFIFGQYPDNPNCAFTFYYQEAVSSMAQTLYHELLHIWYLNVYAGVERRYPTGHGLVTLCEFEDEFLDLLAANAAELSTIEGHPPLNFDSRKRFPPQPLGTTD